MYYLIKFSDKMSKHKRYEYNNYIYNQHIDIVKSLNNFFDIKYTQ